MTEFTDRIVDAHIHVWSPDFETNVAIAMVHKDYWEPETKLIVETPAGEQAAHVREKFWI